MLTVRGAPDILPLIRAKLQERLAQITAHEDESRLARDGTADAEQALYRLMIRYRPRLAENSLAEADIADLLDAAETVAKSTRWDDLRYIDSLNVIYECWPSDAQGDAKRAFLSAYCRALRSLVSS